jgi:hypothetical protein
MKKLALLGCALLAPAMACAQTGDETSAIFDIGHSLKILGSQDERSGEILGVQDVRDDPKFKWRGPGVRPVETIYLMNHFGHDSTFGDTDTFALGVTYGLRLILAPESRAFLQYDFGPQFDTERNHGLPSVFNVTPWLTLGSRIPGKHPLEFGVSVMHISNIYTQRPNLGQDFVMVFVGVKL